jgi:hypothetical protein
MNHAGRYRRCPVVESLERRTLLATRVFFTNFDGHTEQLPGISAQFSGVTTTESVQGYEGYGTGTNIFSGAFLRNTTGGPPAGKNRQPGSPTTLTLTGLPAHKSVDLSFLLAIINSWDGLLPNPDAGPDYFNVSIDAKLIFSEAFDNVYHGF